MSVADAHAPYAWEVVLGLEVHVQLATRTKLFCACPNRFGSPPNTNVCPICTAQPGTLPAPGRAAIELGVRAALALGARVANASRFDRKNYFYCDLPKGFQTTQYALPLATGGGLELDSGALVRLRRIHLEEDAGKALHDRGERTLVDLNRAGVPLIEIVTEPDLRSSSEALAFLEDLRALLVYARVTDGDMERGNLRCDVNVSVRRPSEGLRTKVELKNQNSFKNIELAIRHEIARQIEAYETGGRVLQETRLFDPKTRATRAMRSKEDEDDYRYFPEPDLRPVWIDDATIAEQRAALPEPPSSKKARYQRAHGLALELARVLTETRELADFYERTAELAPPKAAANWIANDLLSALAERGLAAEDVARLGLSPERLAELVTLAEQGRLSMPSAREVLQKMIQSGRSAAELVRELGLEQVSDAGAIERWCRAALEGKEALAAEILSGNEKALGALVGPVMKASGGRANPKLVRETLLRLMRESQR